MLLQQILSKYIRKHRAVLHVLTHEDHVIMLLPTGQVVSLTLWQVSQLRKLLRDAVFVIDDWLEAKEKHAHNHH